ncbi:hypothetical protein SedNR2807_17550 [Citrobacter sedlakii]
MKDTPLISILIPTYNVAPWIEDAIVSILNQTYKKIEVIIIDDCSKDNTLSIVSELAGNDDRIKIITNEQNLKIAKTLNRGLVHASGEYIARFDGDDLAVPERLEKQLKYLIDNKLDLIGCQMISIDGKGNTLNKSISPKGEQQVKTVSNYVSPIAHIWLAKKEVYNKLKGYRDIPYAEDYDFILRAIDCGFKCDNHPDYLMFIRHREGNSASVASLIQRKAHNYVIRLHRKRMRYGNDDFDESQIKMLAKHNIIINKLHNTSSQYLTKAIHEKNTFLKLAYLIITSLTSYYNFQYLYRRVIVRVIMDSRNDK